MKKLETKLNSIPNVYFGFVEGIMAYAKKNPERTKRILQFINGSDHLTTSDVVKFVMLQPDFYEDVVDLDKKLA